MGQVPVTAMEGQPRTQVTVLGMAQAPQDMCRLGSGPLPLLYRRLAPMPSSLGVGLECYAWVLLGSQTPHSRLAA